MNTATNTEIGSGYETSFGSGRGTAVLEPETMISQSRLQGFSGLGDKLFSSRQRNNFFQPTDDVMEDLEWRMGL